jgi:hypothetical protein
MDRSNNPDVPRHFDALLREIVLVNVTGCGPP